MHRFSRSFAVCAVLLGYAGCSPEDRTPGAGATADRGGTDSTAPSADISVPAARDSALRSAAEAIVSFLRGEAAYEDLDVADTVELLIPAEGGGTRQRMARDALRDRHAWTVQTDGQQYSFVPQAHLTGMRVAPGRHFNCIEGALGARVPEFASSPHVGVRLAPPDADSCLQSWNATFVFDTISGQPRLTAAIYDQWEW